MNNDNYNIHGFTVYFSCSYHPLLFNEKEGVLQLKFKSQILPIIIIIGLLFGVVYFTTDYFTVSQYTVTYDEKVIDGQSFYVADGILSGKNQYIIIPSSADKPMSISIDLVETKWIADLYNPATPIKYWELDNLIPQNKPAPYYSVSSIQKVDVSGQVNLAIPGESTQTKTISNVLSVDGSRRVKFNVDGHDIIVQFTDLKFTSGILPPVGTFSVLKKGSTSDYVLMPDSKMKESISGSNTFDGWNTYFWILGGSPTLIIFNNQEIDEWNDVWEWMANKGRLTPGEEIIEPGYNQVVDVYNKKYYAYYHTSDLSQGYEIFVPTELGYLVQVMDQPGFKFYTVSDPQCNEGGMTQVSIKGIATGSGDIRFTLSTDEIYRYDWIYPTNGVLNVEKGTEYTLKANLYSNDDNIVGNDDDHLIVCKANTDGHGDDTLTTFYLHTIDNDDPVLNKYTVTVSAVKDAVNSPIITNANIYFDGTLVSTDGTATINNVIEGTHQIYSENVTGWYAEYTLNLPLETNINSNKNIEILFTEKPPKEGWSVWVYTMFGLFGIVVLGFVVLILNELGFKITMNHILILIGIIIVAVVVWYGIGLLERLIEAIENFKLLGD